MIHYFFTMAQQPETTSPSSFSSSSFPFQSIGFGIAAAVAALWGYFRFIRPSPTTTTTATPQKEQEQEQPVVASKSKGVIAMSALKYLNEKHPMFTNLQEIQTRIYDTDKWQLKQFADAVKLFDAFQGLLVLCPTKKHAETMIYPETAFNIQREFMYKIKAIAQAQRQDDTHVRANIVMEFAELIKDWMTGSIGNLNLMNDDKVAASIIGA